MRYLAIALIITAPTITAVADNAVDTAATAIDTVIAAPAVDTSVINTAAGKAPVDTTVDTAAITAVDTLAIKAANDSLRGARAAAYGATAPTGGPTFYGKSDLFRGDGAGVPEMLRYRALTSVYIPFSLSGSLNRLLHYGDPAWPHSGFPASSVTAQPLFPPCLPRFFGGGQLPGAEAESFAAGLPDGLSYIPYPGALKFPELSVFWENGVFNENILNLRLSRPLGPRLMLNAYSQNRFLNGLRFDHDGNDVANFYKTFYADTSNLMNNGYNPYTDERSMGVALARDNADSSKLYAAFSYANLQNEYALNLPAEAPDRLNWAALNRTVYRFDASITNKELWPLRLNAKAALVNEALRSSYSEARKTVSGNGGALGFFADADVALSCGVGLSAKSMVKRADFFDGDEKTFSGHQAEVFYKREFKLRHATAAVGASAGAALFSGFDTLYTPVYDDGRFASVKAEAASAHSAPAGRAAASLSHAVGKARLTLFAELSPYALYPDYDPSVPPGIPYGGAWASSSVAVGAEAQAQTRFAGLLVGYINRTNSDPYLLRALWPEGCPPYRQPRNTVIVAPWTERVGGFALTSRAIITDTKPFVKASAALSHVMRPAGMEHTFETEFGFDYWSENEPFVLSYYPTANGYCGWDAPVFDLNVKITAHIKTFRLFYKMDNLLNRKLSYVPGYFSPGITFRWGINWFLM
jgi:hypothetical protein